MRNCFKLNLFFVCLILQLKIEYVFSQPDCISEMKKGTFVSCTKEYKEVKCIDIQIIVIDYKLSLYNIAYTFLTQTNELLIINKKCNYQTSGIYYNDGRIRKLFGFMKDSIYSFVLSSADIFGYEKDPLSYYCYVIFNKDKHRFNPKTFNSMKNVKNPLNATVTYYPPYVDINNRIFLINNVHPYHLPPDFLLPTKIYPYYKRTKKGDYVANKRYKGDCRTCMRITMNDDRSETYTPIFSANNAVKPKKAVRISGQ